MQKKQVTRQHYTGTSYATKGRFASYWHQINEIERLQPKTILEIGIGSGFFRRELMFLEQPPDIYSIDIAQDLQPDVVADVTRLPVKSNSVDLVVAFQVLEHLPFRLFNPSLQEMARVSKSEVVLSLPDASPYYLLKSALPLLGRFQIGLSRHFLLPKSSNNPSHYWEIGLQQYPLEQILHSFHASGLSIVRSYRVPEYPYHHFFVLQSIR